MPWKDSSCVTRSTEAPVFLRPPGEGYRRFSNGRSSNNVLSREQRLSVLPQMEKNGLGVTDGDALMELRRLYQAQRKAFVSSPAPGLRTRLESLTRLSATLTQQSPEIAAAISTDFGNRSRHETYLLEMVPIQNAIRHALKNLDRWMRPQRRRVTWVFQPGKAWVQYQPLGIVGIISPWNYPISLAVLPLVDALAAGNRVLLKPPEQTPNLSALLKRLLGQTFAEDEVAVVEGGPDIAEPFSRLPFDHLFFTGGTAVGRRVMMAAAENLTPVTLELGGKCPVLVCPDYPMERAARDIAFGKLANAGQTCIAPDYALVPAARVRAFADEVIAQAQRLYPSIVSNPNYTSILNDRHYHRLRAAIEEARAGGAEILTPSARSEKAGRKLEPTVVLRPPPDCALMREEIFGPVLPILGYETLEAAIAHINAGERPLALYCLTHDRSSLSEVLQRTLSGGVTVNGTILHIAQVDLPFGGVGHSGMGAYHGFAGFQRFSHARSIYQVRVLNLLHFMVPPFGRLARLTVRVLGGRQAGDDC